MNGHMTSNRLRRGAAAIALACLAAAGTACSDDTGILVRITRADVGPLQSIRKIKIYVGTRTPADPPRDRFTGVSETLVDEVELQADLLERPVTRLLKPTEGMALDAEIFVGVVGIGDNSDDPIAIGTIESDRRVPRTVSFVADTVLTWDVVLRTPGDTFPEINPHNCLIWHLPDPNPDVIVNSAEDHDCDDVSVAEGDCDDENPSRSPLRTENCDTEVDEDCDPAQDGHNSTDNDRDLFFTCPPAPLPRDCDDHDQAVHPGATEVCDGKDNDCDRDCDPDPDGDGFTVCGTITRDGSGGSDCHTVSECLPGMPCDCQEGASPGDEGAAIHPGAEEHCDTIDNDCDGICDVDDDGDNYTECSMLVWDDAHQVSTCYACQGPGGAPCDCGPNDPTRGGVDERCDGVDNACDGTHYPALQPCFTPDPVMAGQCAYGQRTCNDTDLADPVGACAPRPGETVAPPSELCDAYAACEDELAADPFECTLAGDHTILSCIAVLAQDLCNPAEVDLPRLLPADTGCTWSVLGGDTHGPWKVGLRASPVMGPPQTTVFSCDVTFVVAAVNATGGNLDQTQKILVVERRGAEAGYLEVDLGPPSFGTCSPEPSQNLRCQ